MVSNTRQTRSIRANKKKLQGKKRKVKQRIHGTTVPREELFKVQEK